MGESPEAHSCRTASAPLSDQTGASFQLRACSSQRAPRREPQVLKYMHDIEHDGHLDPDAYRFGLHCRELPWLAVDRNHQRRCFSESRRLAASQAWRMTLRGAFSTLAQTRLASALGVSSRYFRRAARALHRLRCAATARMNTRRTPAPFAVGRPSRRARAASRVYSPSSRPPAASPLANLRGA